VSILDNAKVAQLNIVDAKLHPDIRVIRNLLFKELGQSWIDSHLDAKRTLSPLWAPCLQRSEVESIVTTSFRYAFCQHLRESITFWSDVTLVEPGMQQLPSSLGEVFFEAGGWALL